MADKEHGGPRENQATATVSNFKENEVLMTDIPDKEHGTDETTSIESNNISQDFQHEPTTRKRKLTVKGQAYYLEKLREKFQSFVVKCRRQSTRIHTLLLDGSDVEVIRFERDLLEDCINDLRFVFNDFSQSVCDESSEEIVCLHRDFYERRKVLEEEHFTMMKTISDFVREKEIKLAEKNTESSCGRKSHSNRSSHSSRKSHSKQSSHSSRSSIETLMEAATLKAKLKFIDIEAKTTADLEKIKTLKELEIAHAKLEVLDSLKDEENSSVFKDIQNIPKMDAKEFTNQYVETQWRLDNTVKFLNPNASDFIPQTSSLPRHVTIPSSRTVPIDPTQTISITQPSFVFTPSMTQFSTRLSSTITQAPQTFPFAPTFGSTMSRFESISVSTSRSSEHLPNVNTDTLTVNQSTPSLSQRNVEQGLLDLANTLAQQISLSRLPPPEPSVFNGDPLKYPGWKIAFQSLIEQRQIPPSERIHYLKKYIGGSVKEVIENYFLVATPESYTEAKTLLDQRYGDSFVIANAFRDKLEKWPKLASRDGFALQKFADFLRQCYTAMQAIGNLDVLNDSRENRKILAKLPDWIVTRWGRIVSQRKEESNQYPPFKEFMDFMSREAKIACDPVTSIQSIKSDQSFLELEKSSKQKKQVRAGQSFSTSTDIENDAMTTLATKSTKPCVLCQGEHFLNDCRKFLAKGIDDRKRFAREKGLCFGCLRIGHRSKDCRQRKKCKLCHRYHPTSLHGDIQSTSRVNVLKECESTETPVSDSSAMTTHSVSAGTKSPNKNKPTNKSSMILPVYVSHIDNPDNERLVYALLDTQSDTTFILEHTCRQLEVTGSNTKLLLSTMFAENQLVDSQKIQGLFVRGFNSNEKIPLPASFTRDIMPANRSHIPTPEIAEQFPHLQTIAAELLPLQNCEIGLLIGYNCAKALTPRDVISPPDDGPFGQKTDLGWGIVGIIDQDIVDDTDHVIVSHRIITRDIQSSVYAREQQPRNHVTFSFKGKVKEVIDPHQLSKMFELDFVDHSSNDKALSRDDRQFISILESGIHLSDGHYEMPLPFRENLPKLPNNRVLAVHRLAHLKRRLERDDIYKNHYVTFMNDVLCNDFAEIVPEEEKELYNGCSWYIPHHGVYHAQKPNKLRVVFDCSAKYSGVSLNDHLLQGPDLTNALVGVLCRFREEPIAIACDVKQMFHQFRVNREHRNYLRFLWWENGDTSKEPQEYRMCVHLFGATSSPGCANFGLKQIANDSELEYGSYVANFIRHNFYVDDGLTSVSTTDEAIDLIQKSKIMCEKKGLHLHKFISNSKDVLKTIPQSDKAKVLENVDMLQDRLPVEKALGIQWCIESDTFQFRIVLRDQPLTRRGVLSTLSSVYDPLGLISPVILKGKQILQQMCRNCTDWDCPLPDNLCVLWEKWRTDLQYLKDLEIKRCFKPVDFGDVVTVELHHFSDASVNGYGQCSYIRLIDSERRVYCSLVMAKSRVTPIKQVTIPRLELTAALVSVKMSTLLRRELDYVNVIEWFWSDSNVTLGYISNDVRRFHVFVANRVQQIRDQTETSQWNYVSSADNPADIASRGVTALELVNNSLWFQGPTFLWKSDSPFTPQTIIKPPISENDPEVKHCRVLTTNTDAMDQDSLLNCIEHYSNWTKAKRVIALCLKLCSIFKDVKREVHATSVLDLQKAEIVLIRLLQHETFNEEIKTLTSISRTTVQCSSPIHRLDPFLDENGILRVGGRIRRGNFSEDVKHPIILPGKSHITELIIRHFHECIKHQGRNMTTNEIRSNGYWIIGCSSAVYRFISKCVKCRKRRNQSQNQKMSDLPLDRLAVEPPFTYSGVDYFGPFLIKEGRKELKRYGVLFTCMSSRAVHLETANSLDTSSFINSLRRFLSIRGPIRQLRSDRGTNFVGAKRELREALENMDDDRLKGYLTKEGCDYIVFHMNVPAASHMGGIWERQIRTVRNVLSSLMDDFGAQLDDETLRTFFCEAMAIVNSRQFE